ncbi:hypothetical protein J31TS4_07830 [Paenibacillus sp. J31TS4]|uniref:CPBP family intramembrane glutamic endopeptidase n=1 Tax=Paenibacillus sp. J31TS4 TaxID=2807195 RepID=UPI001B06AA4E|nr:CPBP family intramembrane glutamic endopeptidase [Paenibacillus sp. J31TS4]GIP37503.1 hypothetical protein J31TS4_07830 [Paenibacillus sp. J31TS4]
MKRWKFRKPELRRVDVSELDDRTLLLNVYLTQLLCLLLGASLVGWKLGWPWTLFGAGASPIAAVGWGAGFALLVVSTDLFVTRLVPEHVTDDGGVNERLFADLPLWHIALLCAFVSVCEELLFRGGVQEALGFGPYWTSILFAVIHVRYLQHWLMTGLVFAISYGLGWLYAATGTLWTPVIAHFLIDFILGCIIRFGRKDS